VIVIGVIAVVAIGLVVFASDTYARSAHALDGLVDPRVLRPVKERVQKLRASR
jgi:hypothetical protein